MPRKALGPRLYLRKDGAKKIWIIRDNGYDTRTRCGEDDTAGALKAMSEYKARPPVPVRMRLVGVGLIYFVTCISSSSYPIKIGWTSSLGIRLEKMQNANPNLLTALAMTPGTGNDERLLHDYFSHLRIRGEWFRRGDDLMGYIATLRGDNEAAYGDDEFAPSFPPHEQNDGTACAASPTV